MTKYNVSDHKTMQDASQSALTRGFESGNADRFAGHDSQYNAPAGPAVTKYNVEEKTMNASVGASSMLVAPMESGVVDRFAQGGVYKKGLRKSTIPEARDPSSFPKPRGAIAKNTFAARGAALKAALKATMAGGATPLDSVAETAEAKENDAEAMVEA